MELHDLAQYRLPRTRRVPYLALSEDWWPRNVAMLRMMNRPAGAGHAH
jgi:hypothetical protein